MVLSRKAKVYLGVLPLAVVALLVDRLVLDGGKPGPEQASAAPMAARPTKPSALQPAPVAAVPAPAPPAPSPPLGRLAALMRGRQIDPQHVRDAFAPAPSWLPPAPEPPAPKAPEPKKLPDFQDRHELTAVIMGPQGARAIVDGKCLAVGQTLDGMKLISIGRKTAVFAGGGVRAELAMPGSKPSGTSP
jgi:hypothetical protein